MRPSSKRLTSIGLALIIFIVAFVFYSALIKKEFTSIQQLRGEVGAKTQLLVEQQNAVSQIRSLLQQYEGVAQLQQTISLSLPQEEDLASVVAQFNAIANNGGVSIESINVSVAPIQATATSSLVYGYGVSKFNLRVIGSYEAFKSFIQSLETNVRLMDVKSIKLGSMSTAGTGQKTQQNIFNYDLSVETYYQTR